MGNNPSLVRFGTNHFQNGSVVVITGGCSGMGRELVYKYASRGCKVVVGDLRMEPFAEIEKKCKEDFGNADVIGVQTDVSNEEAAKNLVETAATRFG